MYVYIHVMKIFLGKYMHAHVYMYITTEIPYIAPSLKPFGNEILKIKLYKNQTVKISK